MESATKPCKPCNGTGTVKGILCCNKCRGTGEITYNASADTTRPYKLVSVSAVFCRSTDALMGSRRCVEAAFATYGEAFVAASKAAGRSWGDVNYSVCVVVDDALVPAPESVFPAESITQDDSPF